MDRKEFIRKAGLGAAMAMSGAACLHSCLKAPLRPGDGKLNVSEAQLNTRFKIDDLDITLDLDHPDYFFLQFPEGYVILQDKSVVVAKTKAGEYIAAVQICSDENLPGITYSGDEWFCVEHDATFDHAGNGTTTYNNLGLKGIQVFNTELNGNLLRIFS